jgi:hypothetical protein
MMNPVDTLDDIRVGVMRRQPIMDMNSSDDEDAILRLHLSADFADEPTLARRNLARLQRAPEGSGQSATGGSHHIVDRRCMGLGDGQGDAVVLGDRPMRAECDRSRFGWQIGQSNGAAHAFDAYARDISNRSHHILW